MVMILQRPLSWSARECGVGLDAIYGYDGIGLGCVTIPIDRHAVSFADLLDFQAAVNRNAKIGHPVADEDGMLAFGSAAAVTTHCRDEEGVGANCLQGLDDRLYHFPVAGDSAAAYGHSHPHPRPNAFGQCNCVEAVPYCGRYIVNLLFGDGLPHWRELNHWDLPG